MDNPIILAAVACLVLLLLAIAFLKMKKGKEGTKSKDTSKDTKSKKKGKKGASSEEVDQPVAPAKPTVNMAQIQSQINILVQQKDYAKAEGILNASLKDDNTLYPLYANLLNLYHLQNDDLAVRQLFSSIERQGLNEIYQKLHVEHESYQQIKLQELARQSELAAQAPVIEEPIEVTVPTPDTSAFDNLAFDISPATSISKPVTDPVATGNTLDFAPSTGNSLDFHTTAPAAEEPVPIQAAALATASVGNASSNVLSFDNPKVSTINISQAPNHLPAEKSYSFDFADPSTPKSTESDALSLDTPADQTFNFEHIETPTTNTPEVSVPELILPEIAAAETQADASADLTIDSSFDTDFNFDSLDTKPASNTASLDQSLNFDAPAVQAPTLSNDTAFSFDLDAPAVAPKVEMAPALEDNTFDLSNSDLLSATPTHVEHQDSVQFDHSVADADFGHDIGLPEVHGNTFDAPSIDTVAHVEPEAVAVVEEPAIYADERDPFVQYFPALIHAEPTNIDLDLVEQYIRLGQLDAAKDLLNETKTASTSAKFEQRISELESKIA
ncbi:hypothetical protein [Acinetobacter sp. c3-l95]|uniref:hypothetical protein n=1 Tax=Acinetobacter sp. c3-l95 TaxID=3342804 RepID=UPI0035B73C6A